MATFQDVMLAMLNLTDMMEDLHVPLGFMETSKIDWKKRKSTYNIRTRNV
ncbi:hypothetical protein [Neobacillus vireti]